MDFYYAVFQKEDGNTLVSIPDVEICETFGKTWDEAYFTEILFICRIRREKY